MMDKIEIKDDTSIEKVVELTANKVNELVVEYNEMISAYNVISSRMKKMDKIYNMMMEGGDPCQNEK